jgi:aminoglycoside N3'-acetyltransferase
MNELARTLLRGAVRGVLRTGNVGEFIRLRRLALEKKVYRREISLAELRALLVRLGFARGRVVWVQSSWNEFYNLRNKPTDVIAVMRDLLGADGTLAMPAFPLDQDPEKILDIDLAPVSTGLLTEIFRRSRDVKRSIHLSSSVCAVGPAADFLVRDHHHEFLPWGPKSPYCRLMDAEARLVGLGAGPYVSYLTPLHAVECLLYDEVPLFRRVFDGTISYRWRRRSGETGTHSYARRTGRIDPARYGRQFPAEIYDSVRLSNLQAVATDARTAIRHGLALGRRGITLYVESSIARPDTPSHIPDQPETR